MSLFSNAPVYSHDFSVRKDFSHTQQCHFYQDEFHIFNETSGYLCWETTFRTPESNRIQGKILTAEPQTLQSEHHGGILFRLSNLDNALLFYIYPASKKFGIGFWEITPNNPQGNWKTVLEEPSSEILDYENILDVINIKENFILLINGKKVYQGNHPFSENIPFRGFTGFFASKGSHFHFDDLKVWETQEAGSVNPVAVQNKAPSFPQDIPEVFESYGKIKQPLISYSFNDRNDTPFAEKKIHHTEMGKFVIWNDALGLRMLASSVTEQAYLIESSVRIGNARQMGFAGITAKAGREDYYALKINPFSKKVKLEKTKNSQTLILFEMEDKNILSGEKQENILALKVQENLLTAYINGVRVKEVKESNPLEDSYGYGLVSDTGDPVYFGFVRVLELQKSFFARIKGWLIFIIVIAAFVYWIKRKKKRKNIELNETLKQKIIRELLKEMPSRKEKRVFDRDLIFRYQMTKKQAEEVLTELSTQYGGVFDSDEEGNLFVSFD